MRRLHDRKVCVLGLCCLMDTPANRPSSINDISAELLPAAIMIFNGLKRAYEREYCTVKPRHLFRTYRAA